MKKIILSMILAVALNASDENVEKRFGANLFNGSFSTVNSLRNNESYILKPSDVITVKMWGIIEYQEDLTIDSQGNIFIPKLGVLPLAGKKKSQINEEVAKLINSKYKHSVNAYADLKQFQPISIYVSGYAVNPGLYAGNATDSILQYIDKAKGINEEGSYRNIDLIRNGVKINSFDLYDFLEKGFLSELVLKDGDSIFIHPSTNSIYVKGDCSTPIKYETNGEVNLSSLAKSCGVKSSVNSALIETFDNSIKNIDLKEFSNKVSIPNKSIVNFLSENKTNKINLIVKSSDLKKTYISDKDTLKSFLDKNNISSTNIKLYRKSVALRQKELLNKSLQDLEANVLTSPSMSIEEANIRKQEAQSIINFIDRAKKIEPLGQVILNNTVNLSLEEGDMIEILPDNQPVVIQGEVNFPTAQVFNEDYSLKDYISLSGGFNEKANESKIIILKQNGEAILYENGLFDFSPSISKGDSIIVLSEIDTKYFQSAKDITQVLYQIAVGAAVAIKAF